MRSASNELETLGFIHAVGPFYRPEDAWITAGALIEALSAGELLLEVIGEFVLPPSDGVPSRDFQTLHIDFGVPLIPGASAPVARFTALHIPIDAPSRGAVTRLVPLRVVGGEVAWPDPQELVRRFTAYGESHGSWDDGNGYLEGNLARIVEAALGETPELPSVKSAPGFLCGTEFQTLADELSFFAERGFDLESAEIGICLHPGELLVFDNLMLAHGRRGAREPGELHQRVFGHRHLSAENQAAFRDRVLEALTR